MHTALGLSTPYGQYTKRVNPASSLVMAHRRFDEQDMTKKTLIVRILLCCLAIAFLTGPPSSLAIDGEEDAIHLQSVDLIPLENGVRITIEADGAIADYTSFTLSDPPRIVFDLYQMTVQAKTVQTISADTEAVKQARYYGHPDKVRLVIDTKDRYLSSFSVDTTHHGLQIDVGRRSVSAEKENDGIIAADDPGASPTLGQVPSEAMSDETVRVARGESSPRPAEKPGEESDLSKIVDEAVKHAFRELTLQEVILQAIDANINLKSLRESTKSALAFKKISQTAFLPTLSATYRYTHLHEEAFDEYGGGVRLLRYPQGTYAFAGTLTQPLFAGFSLINQYNVAKLGVNISKLNEELIRQTVILSAKQGYFSLLKAQKLLTVSQLAVRQLGAHTTVAQNFYQVGMIPLNDLLKAQVELANATQSLIVVRNGLNIAKSNLNLILRRDINASIKVVDVTDYSPFDRDIDYCLQTAEDDRLEIRIAALDVKRKEREVEIAKKDLYPSVNLNATVNQSGTDWNADGGHFRIDGNSWNASAVATWNFWEWGRTRQGIRAKKAELKQSRLKQDEVFDTIRLEVKQAYLRTREGEKNITTVQKAIEQAKENFRISEERYKEQMVTSTDVLDAQTLLSTTMTNYYNALYDFKIAKASLYRAMGQEVME